MKNLGILIVFTILSCRCYAQEKVPVRYISTDVVYDAESIPNLGYERFFVKKDKLRSWRVSAAYQVHYSNQFGVVTSHGDRISIGVYQGPALDFARTIYSARHRNKWNNYFSYGLGLKYLWYDSVQVNTSKNNATELAYRIQAEKCYAGVPQFAIGAKRIKGDFCADFYIGLQVPVKYRYKTIYYEQDNNTYVNPDVPYNKTQVMVEPGLLVGIKLGFIKMKRADHDPSQNKG